MGLFSKNVIESNLPKKALETTFQSFYDKHLADIIDFMEVLGYAYSDDSRIHINYDYATRASGILTEYALFLKACTIYYVKKNAEYYSKQELEEVFPLANGLVRTARSIAAHRSAVSNRIKDYFDSIDKNIIRGYCIQNFDPRGSEFIEDICSIDTMRFALMFADCYYYIVLNEKYAKSKDIKSIKKLAKYDSCQKANYYLKIAEKLKLHADLLEKEIETVFASSKETEL